MRQISNLFRLWSKNIFLISFANFLYTLLRLLYYYVSACAHRKKATVSFVLCQSMFCHFEMSWPSITARSLLFKNIQLQGRWQCLQCRYSVMETAKKSYVYLIKDTYSKIIFFIFLNFRRFSFTIWWQQPSQSNTIVSNVKSNA